MKKILIVDDQTGWQNFNKGAIKEILGNDAVIDTAQSAREGYEKVFEHVKEPYDFILTDMQMENDFAPKMAGEWFIEQIQNIHNYYKTRIIIISASPKIKYIAETYNTEYIPKSTAVISLEPYKELLL